jgi:iron(III) transport system permease protein
MSAPVEVLERATRPPAEPARGRHGQKRLRPAVAISAAIVAAAATLPAVYLIVRALGTEDLRSAVTTGGIGGLLLRTSALCLAVTATTIAIALPFAWLTTRTDLPGRRLWIVVSALPLVIPSFVGGYAFVAALGPRGLVQGWLEPLGVERLPSIYGFGGAWLVLSLFTYPLALLPIRAALAGMDPSLTEAARTLGRSPARAFFRITLPQLRPALVSGGLLVALYTLSDFGAVSLMRFRSLTVEALIRFKTFDRDGAAVVGVITLLVAVIVLVVEARTRGHLIQHGTHRGVRRQSQIVHLGPWRWIAFAGCAVVIVLALVLPVGVIVVWLARSLAASGTVEIAVVPALRSMQASLVGAIAVVLCAWPVAAVAARHGGWFARFTEGAAYTGYAMPGVVLAIAFVFFGAPIRPLYQTLAFLVLAYVVHFLPQATGTLRTAIAQIHPGLEEAARSLGASTGEVLRRVTLPLVRPGALTAFALVFLTVMKELPLTLLLAPPGFRTLATLVWDKASAASFGEAALPALGLVALSSVPMAVLVVREQRHATG